VELAVAALAILAKLALTRSFLKNLGPLTLRRRQFFLAKKQRHIAYLLLFTSVGM
jgi:hypothetical protein